jgi:hypothetical protein
VRHPAVFLFDEPLSNLDAALRMDTRMGIDRLQRQLDATMTQVILHWAADMGLAGKVGWLRDVVERLWAAVESTRAEAAWRQGETPFLALVTAPSYAACRMSRDWREMRKLDGRGFLNRDAGAHHQLARSYLAPEDQPAVPRRSATPPRHAEYSNSNTG